jgi:hypothetical protein
MFTGKKSRKDRLAEYALERQAVFAAPPLSTPTIHKDGSEDEDEENVQPVFKPVSGVMAYTEPLLVMSRDGPA